MTESVPPLFTGEELRNSVPFDPERMLRGDGADELVAHVCAQIAQSEQRARALKAKDLDARERTVRVYLANLAAAALNRVDPNRFVALSRNRTDYANTDLSYASVRLLWDVLRREGLTEGREGFRRFDFRDEAFGRLSRVRGTPALHDLFTDFGIGRRSVRTQREQLLRLNKPDANAGQPPPGVDASQAVLERVNARLGGASISLPDEAWERIATIRSDDPKLTADRKRHLQYEGDSSAVALYRVFTRSWDRGGRLYGGWWINVDKSERPLITINGEATAELDYGQLHPSLLFARKGLPLTFDPYDLPPFSRELGKETFARLLNRTEVQGGVNLRRAQAAALPTGTTFDGYLALLLKRLEPVREWLGVGEGMSLQREDSDLAIGVLDRLESEGIIALPIHDSFIVQHQHVTHLHTAMVENYSRRYGHEPHIRGSSGNY
jgi:hypothetical protein